MDDPVCVFATGTVRHAIPVPSGEGTAVVSQPVESEGLLPSARIRGLVCEWVRPTRPVALDATYRIAPRWLGWLDVGETGVDRMAAYNRLPGREDSKYMTGETLVVSGA